jgi:tetratricopeptide (TPR) repeat protein
MTATTTREIETLRGHVSAEQFVSLERHGLAAYLVAAPALERKLATRRHAPGDRECPEGVAVVVAAADWARCGRTDPISDHTLRQLWPSYLSADAAATDEVFEIGVAWALRPVAGTIALLHRAGSYQAFDYVVRLVRDKASGRPPPDAAWSAAIDGATDAQALAVATAAYDNDRFNDTMQALGAARQSSVDEVAAIAGYNLGVVLGALDRFEDELGVYEEVLARFGDATEPGLRAQVAKALFNKGVRLGALDRFEDELGVYEEVLARFGDATEPGLRAQVAKALFNKGVRLGGAGSLRGRARGLRGGARALRRHDRARAARGGRQGAVQQGRHARALDRFEDELGVYEEVLARFGNATEPALRQAVAMARQAREQRASG